MENIASFVEAAILKLTARIADDCEYFAAEMEKAGDQCSGPDALRRFAGCIRRANKRAQSAE